MPPLETGIRGALWQLVALPLDASPLYHIRSFLAKMGEDGVEKRHTKPPGGSEPPGGSRQVRQAVVQTGCHGALCCLQMGDILIHWSLAPGVFQQSSSSDAPSRRWVSGRFHPHIEEG